MKARLDWQSVPISIDLSRGTSIAIPLEPEGPQPSFFTDKPARSMPLVSGDYVGDVRRGGSCNADVVLVTPHCHGTHTECVGHIMKNRQRVQETIVQAPTVARLVSIEPEPAKDGEHPRITLEQLEERHKPGVEALVIRTLPNDTARRSMDYSKAAPFPVLTGEAMAWLAIQPLLHLLVDAPSLDPANDDGALNNHRLWWGLHGPASKLHHASKRSVTEMIFVPDSLNDGLYWMHLELSPIAGDATPSRPILYPLEIMT